MHLQQTAIFFNRRPLPSKLETISVLTMQPLGQTTSLTTTKKLRKTVADLHLLRVRVQHNGSARSAKH